MNGNTREALGLCFSTLGLAAGLIVRARQQLHSSSLGVLSSADRAELKEYRDFFLECVGRISCDGWLLFDILDEREKS